jgi:DNA (cytosine-5)-methyltransferase 1
MTHGSLFSGIGGFDLAAEYMGWENVFHCEINPFCRKILKYYWPNAKSYENIQTTDFTIYRDRIQILTGGFPCQPYSSAGKRLGKADTRHLWPNMLRAINEIKPRYVVGENVRGLTNWSNGMVFNEVCAEMEDIGYQVAPYLIPACATNAPHRRERIWFIAYANNKNERKKTNDRKWKNKKQKSNNGHNLRDNIGSIIEKREIAKFKKYKYNYWEKFPTVNPICTGNDGLSKKLDGITFHKWREETLKGCGNAIVPQVAIKIFEAIQKFENLNQTNNI